MSETRNLDLLYKTSRLYADDLAQKWRDNNLDGQGEAFFTKRLADAYTIAKENAENLAQTQPIERRYWLNIALQCENEASNYQTMHEDFKAEDSEGQAADNQDERE